MGRAMALQPGDLVQLERIAPSAIRAQRSVVTVVARGLLISSEPGMFPYEGWCTVLEEGEQAPREYAWGPGLGVRVLQEVE